MNAPFRLSGLYKTVITVVSESSAIYAVTFLLFIGTWAVDNPAEYFFFPVLAQAQVRTIFPDASQFWVLLTNSGDEQVIAPFLTVLRVANRKTPSNSIISGDIGSIRYLSQGESTVGSWTPHGGHSQATSTDVSGETVGKSCVEAVTTANMHRDGV